MMESQRLRQLHQDSLCLSRGQGDAPCSFEGERVLFAAYTTISSVDTNSIDRRTVVLFACPFPDRR